MFKVEKNEWYFRKNGSLRGKKQVLLWLWPEDLVLIKGLSAAANRPVQEVLSEMVQYCLISGKHKPEK